MATATVSGLTLIEDMETSPTITNIGGGPGAATTNDVFIEGTQAVGRRINSTSVRGFGVDFTAIDFTVSGRYLWVWWNAALGASNARTRALGGLRIRVSSTSGAGSNYAEWYVGGGDVTQNGVWNRTVIDINGTTATNTSGTPNFAAIINVSLIYYYSSTPGGNIPHLVMDALHYGSNITVTGGTTSDKLLWSDVSTATEANVWGVLRQPLGASYYLANGNIQFGAASSADCILEDSSQVIEWAEQIYYNGTALASLIPNWLQGITIDGSANTVSVTDGQVVGSGSNRTGFAGSVFQIPSGTLNDFSLDVRSTISGASFYGTSIRGLSLRTTLVSGNVGLGTGSLELIDATLDRPDIVDLDISSSLFTGIRAKVIDSQAVTSAGSLVLVNPTTIDGDELSVVIGNGFGSKDDATTQTFTVKNHDFTTNTQYVRVFQNKTWDIINPTGFTVNTSSQTELSFNTTSGTEVNEKYVIDVQTQTPAGTILSQSAVYIYEGLLNDNLPANNQMYTDATGIDTSNILVNRFTSEVTTLGVTASGDFVLKAYKYGYSPFITALTVDKALSQVVNFTVDTAISSPTSASAIAAGTGVIPIKHSPGETDPLPLVVMHYDGGAGTIPAQGDTITGGTSTAAGSVLETRYGDNTDAYLVLSGWNGTQFTNNETLSNGIGWTALADTTGGASSFFENYTWEYQMSGFTHQLVYDYDRARTAQEPVNTPTIYQDAIIWGQAEQPNMIFSNGSTYFTERNIVRQEGVWLANPSDSGVVEYMTSDSGSQFIPPQSYTFTLTGLKSLSEVRIYDTATDPPVELAGVENSSTTFSYNYTYSGADVNIYVVIFHLQYRDIRLVNLVLSNADQSLPIQQQTDRVYLNPI